MIECKPSLLYELNSNHFFIVLLSTCSKVKKRISLLNVISSPYPSFDVTIKKSYDHISKACIFVKNLFSDKGYGGVTLMAENKDCSTKTHKYTDHGYIKTVEECGSLCFGLSTLISYAKTKDRCSYLGNVLEGCKCYCFDTPKEGICDQEESDNYDIYRIKCKLF